MSARRRGNSRGTVLVHVLMTTAILGYLAALTLRASLQSSMYESSMESSVRHVKEAEAALSKIQAAWDFNGGTCSSLASAGVSCGPIGGCSCTCTAAGLKVTSSGPSGGPCALSITAP